jgi:ribosomal protein S11
MAKTSRPMVRIHDLETNEVVDREMNDTEFAQYEADQATAAAQTAAEAAKAEQKAALLERLGITAEEAQLLLGGN